MTWWNKVDFFLSREIKHRSNCSYLKTMSIVLAHSNEREGEGERERGGERERERERGREHHWSFNIQVELGDS